MIRIAFEKAKRTTIDEDQKLLQAAMKRMDRAVGKVFMETLEEMVSKVSNARMDEFATGGNPGGVAALFDLDEFSKTLEGSLRTVFLNGVQEGAEVSLMRLPQKKVVKQVGFDITNPAVIEWIREHVAGLVALITEQTRNAIKEVIEYHYVKGYHVRTTAKQIKNLVGLTRGQAKAVATYESELLGRGLTRDVIDKRLERYGKSLLKRRAEMIARTETSEAVNYGRKKAWDDAVEDGIIDDRTVYREWVTGADERVCPICGPMHGQTRALDEPFDTPDGEVDNPPAHPNCRCTMIMRQGDTGKLPPRARPEKQKNRFGGPIGKPRKLKR